MAVLGTACSGKADSITKVDGKKTFDKLSADDRKQLCTDFIAFGKKNRNPKADQEMSCKMSAVFDSGSSEDSADKKKACKESYDTCMSKPAKDEQPDEMDCKFLDEMKCDITVDDFIGCVREQIDAGKAMANEVSCDKLPDGDPTKYAMELIDKMSGGPKCKAVKDRCDKPKD
jgi:hypothetical protein